MSEVTIQYHEKTILQRLEFLYGKEARQAHDELQELLENFRVKIESQEYHLSEKDVILITYGDQLRKSGEAPLKTLKDFLDVNVRHLINSVHILPFYPYSSDDGFSVIDYTAVDARIGSWKHIELLKQTGYRVMFDGVVNHMSRHSYWFRRYLSDDPKYENFFIDADPGLDYSEVVRPRTSPLLTEFTDEHGRVRSIWTTFSEDQVDLNYSNYKVLLRMIEVLLFYIEKGARLIRLDAIAFLWKEMGTTSVHLPQTHEVIQLMREVLNDVAPEVIIITETNVPHKENISYFGDGKNEAQMVYNFALPPLLAHAILKGRTDVLQEWAESLELPSDKVCFFNFTASHDGVGVRPVSEILHESEILFLTTMTELHGGRVSYRAKGDGTQSPYELNCNYMDLLTAPQESDELRASRMLLSQAVTLSMPGVPGIYFHSLVGSRNDLEGLSRKGINRAINREKFRVDSVQDELDDGDSLRSRIFREYKKMLSLRQLHPAFNPFGKYSFPVLYPGIFAIRRESRDGSEKILSLHNFTEVSHSITIPDEFKKGVDLFTGEVIESVKVDIAGYQTMWVLKTAG